MRKLLDGFKVTAMLFGIVLAMPNTTYATESYTMPGICTVDTVAGTGHCEGNYDDIRNYPYDRRWASFVKVTGPLNYVFFQMMVNNKYSGCSGSSSMLDAWNTAMAAGSHLWFGIDFNLNNGQCTRLELDVSSVYH